MKGTNRMGLNLLPPGDPYLGRRPGQGHLQRKFDNEQSDHINT
jgi:hypothetical protein